MKASDIATRIKSAAGVLAEITGEYQRLDQRVEELLTEREQVTFAPWPRSVILVAVEQQLGEARAKFLDALPARLADIIQPDPQDAFRKGLNARQKKLHHHDLLCTHRAGAPAELDPTAVLGLLAPLISEHLRAAVTEMPMAEPEGLAPEAREKRLAEIDVELDKLEGEKAALVEAARRGGLSVTEETLVEGHGTPLPVPQGPQEPTVTTMGEATA